VQMIFADEVDQHRAIIHVKGSHEDLTLDVIRVARPGLTNMRPSKKVLVSRDHLNSFSITI